MQNYNEDNFAQPAQECLASKQVEDIVPAQPQPDSIFAHSMQPMNVAPCWPLDLVQNNEIPQVNINLSKFAFSLLKIRFYST